jgi:chemotaxis protein MotB
MAAGKSKKPPEPGAPSVPAYIVTFSDMVTLLLTFFVMLLSLAQVQDPELFNRSRDAFNEHINCYGLGILMGKQLVPDFGEKRMKYFIPDPPDEDQEARTIDSNDEELRRLFNKVAESMEVTPSRLDVRLSDFSPAMIYFSQGQTELDDTGRGYLDRLAIEFPRSNNLNAMKVYVLGLAPDETDEQQQWIISSARAWQVAGYLAQVGFDCPIYSWGVGSGGAWVEQDSPISRRSHIFIAFVKADE